ncbi:Carboxymethylenebutenolidase [Andreprevotia sp. IGB-42]|uniref:dienelactone hydrolase family protein n=1 Tax=Andreprevotia sp. IGB-42 TaxID=2497473 RepID=UPI001356B183|nr:dienelactone hydrolase family protein [Andreprevotia sp. IGB-42]KAF0815213.1 Carboxymethylenebutenolidase [Andreprevotia sp. IGB-42]
MPDEPQFDPASRRHFLAAGAALSISAGFARAVAPIAASAVATDSVGLEAGPVGIPVAGATLPAYQARPAGAKGPLPVVIVVQEIFGVHEHIQDVCRRLAKQGYLAIAPELYFRQGDPRQYTDTAELMSKVVSRVPDQQVLTDLDMTCAWAVAHGGDGKRLAMTGFCWGGRIVWLYAAHNPYLKAGAAWYGRLVGQPSPNNPKQPIDVVTQLKAPVIGFYGGKDQGITQEHVEAMRAALKAAGRSDEINVYPEAGHAFNADYRPSYNAAAANDAWGKMLAFFKQKGVAPAEAK